MTMCAPHDRADDREVTRASLEHTIHKFDLYASIFNLTYRLYGCENGQYERQKTESITIILEKGFAITLLNKRSSTTVMIYLDANPAEHPASQYS